MIEFKLPAIGEGVVEVEIVRWLKQPGDAVAFNEAIVEVMTDKATVEIPSPHTGVVSEIRANEGVTAAVGQTICTLDAHAAVAAPVPASTDATAWTDATASTDASASTDAPASTDASSPARVLATPAARALARESGIDLDSVVPHDGRITKRDVEEARRGQAATPSRPAPPAHAQASSPPRSAYAQPSQNPSAYAQPSQNPAAYAQNSQSPSAYAQNPSAYAQNPSAYAQNPPAHAQPPQNPSAYAQNPSAYAQNPSAYAQSSRAPTSRAPNGSVAHAPGLPAEPGRGAPTLSARDPEPSHHAAPSSPHRGTQAKPFATPTSSRAAMGPASNELVERIPFRGMRRKTAEMMTRAYQSAVHYTYVDEVNVTQLVAVRNQAKKAAAADGIALNYLPFVIKAVIRGLKKFPFVNAQLDEAREEILLHRRYDIGIATATEHGLFVPVVRDADRKSLLDIAAEVQHLVDTARQGQASREQLGGSTFTVTSLGALGGLHATPILNYPEVGILGVHAIRKIPMVDDHDQIVIGHVMNLSVSFDHRIVDGFDGASFLQEIKRYLEDPTLLLLAGI